MPKANVTWQRMPSAILITPAKIGSKQNENFVKDIREAFARRAFVKDILPFSYPLLPFCAKHFALARRPRQPFHNKPRRLKIATHFAFRAIGNEDSSFTQQIETLLHALQRPQARLYARSEGIVINDIEFLFGRKFFQPNFHSNK